MKRTTMWDFVLPGRLLQSWSYLLYGVNKLIASVHGPLSRHDNGCYCQINRQVSRVSVSRLSCFVYQDCRKGWLTLFFAVSWLFSPFTWARTTPTLPLITEPQPPCQFNPQSSPEMVLIPGGHFQMGSADDAKLSESDEKPQHWVAVQPFAISRCEITVAQFRQFVDETGYITSAETPDATQQGNIPKGCFGLVGSNFGMDSSLNWRNTGFEQSAQHPVTCISWDDSQAYIQWLTARTGVAYRLPTEAEWEYAARVNSTGQFGFGDDAESTLICDFANVSASQCDDGIEFTAPVGQFTPNGFGLYDMHGNVWEWTQDCWHGDYNGAPVDGAAWAVSNEGDCSRRVVRGGSWNYPPGYARSAYRYRSNRNETSSSVGFRVARTL